jgi:beta-lactamase class A
MKRFYENLIHSRIFPAILVVLVGGYIVGFFNLLFLGYLPVLSRLQYIKYPLLDPAENFIEQSNYIVNIEPLRKFLISEQGKIGENKISIYLESLNSGANIAVNRDLRMFPASLAKLPLALVVMNKVENKELQLTDMETVAPEDIDGRSGSLQNSVPGTSYSINALLSALLINSDNTAQHMLLKLITPEDMQDLINNTGLEALADSNGKISAKEFSRFFRALYTSSYLSRDDSQKLLKMLSASTFKDFLSQGLPSQVPFAHKYGEDINAHIYIDSGIVYLPQRPYMMTVMIQNVDRATAQEIMKTISSRAYQYFSTFTTDQPPLVPLN